MSTLEEQLDEDDDEDILIATKSTFNPNIQNEEFTNDIIQNPKAEVFKSNDSKEISIIREQRSEREQIQKQSSSRSRSKSKERKKKHKNHSIFLISFHK